jgi:miniconductance mechanosensitive channel
MIVKLISIAKLQIYNLLVSSSAVAKAEKEISQITGTYAKWVDLLKNWLIQHGVSTTFADIFKSAIVFAAIAILAFIADFLVKRIFLAVVFRIAKKTETILDDILVEQKVFHRLAHFAPAFVIYYTISLPLADFPGLLKLMQDLAQVYMIIVGLRALLAVVNALQVMYLTLPISKNHSIKGYLQVVKIILYLFAGIFIISAINDTPPVALLTSLGALAAVLMFVFKDPILGLVASIQLSVNDMLRPGDWIEMPSRKADGIVLDISLTTIKVQNWDKTITTIPTYSLVADSFTNWRGMEEAEGRRIKKAIYIDMKSVTFISDKLLENLSKNQIIARNFDIEKFKTETLISESYEYQTLTNLSIFRAYLEAYLKNLEVIHNEMTQLVHYLQPNENGLPVEIIAFSKEKAGTPFEKLQCELLEHILAILPTFELKVFQRPTGDDFQRIVAG